MSIQLRDLIRQVRACKTAADERAITTKESALIRTAFKDESMADYRHRNVAKLLYMAMLGYPTHFGQMECIKMLASPRFADKRIGYLALMLLLDENTEVLMLVTNSLQMDINSSSQFAVGLALTALGNIGSGEMARDLANDVERQLRNPNPYVRKKAALCTIRLLRKVPELVETFLPSIVQLLLDKNHNVLLTGVSLVSAVIDVAPAYTDKFVKLVPALVKILRKLISALHASEYEVGGVTDPFLQCRILSLLCQLGRTSTDATEAMNIVLAQVASQTETAKNAGNAVLYEAVNTIMSVEAETGLRVLAVNILGKFLSNKDNNIKYVALQTLCKVVHADAPAVSRHRSVIIECLRDGDVSIRRRALELVYALVNADSVRLLTREMLAYLAVCSEDSKGDLCHKLAVIAERFAPTPRWHIDTLITVIAAAGNAAKRELASVLLFRIAESTPLDHAAVTHKLFCMVAAAVAGSGEAQQLLLQVGAWVIGEYGALLLSPPPPRVLTPSHNAAIVGEGLAAGIVDDLSGPYGEMRSEADIVRLLERLLTLHYSNGETKALTVTAALKLTARFSPTCDAQARLRRLIASFSHSADLELQARSVEYSVIADPAPQALLAPFRATLLEGIPLLNEIVMRERAGLSDAGGEGAQHAMAIAERSQPRASGASASAAAAPPTKAAAASRGLLDLDDLFSSVTSTAGTGELGTGAAPIIAATPSAAGGLDDIFGSSGGAPVPRAAAAAAAAPASAASLASSLGSLYGQAGGAGASQWGEGAGGGAGAPSADPFSSLGGGGGFGAGVGSGFAGGGGLGDIFGASAPVAATAPPPLLLRAGGTGAPAASGGAPFADLLGSALPLPAPAPPRASSGGGGMGDALASAPVGGTAATTFTAFEGANGLRVAFRCEKPAGSAPGASELTALISCSGLAPLTSFAFLAAVPKFVKLTLLPPSGTTIAPGAAPVTLLVRVENSQVGVKPLAIRLRLSYSVGGGDVVEQADVKAFPSWC